MAKLVVNINDKFAMVIFDQKLLRAISSPNLTEAEKYEEVCQYLADNSFYPDHFKIMAASSVKELFDFNNDPKGVA